MLPYFHFSSHSICSDSLIYLRSDMKNIISLKSKPNAAPHTMACCTVGHCVWPGRPLCPQKLVIVRTLADNNQATTKAPKFALNTESIWKCPALSLIWMFHIFRNASWPPPQTQMRKRFGLLGECGLFFSPLTHGRKNVCRLREKREGEEDRGEERKTQREGKQERMGRGRNGWMEIQEEQSLFIFLERSREYLHFQDSSSTLR